MRLEGAEVRGMRGTAVIVVTGNSGRVNAHLRFEHKFPFAVAIFLKDKKKLESAPFFQQGIEFSM